MIFLKIITVIVAPFLVFGACWLGAKLGMKAARRDKKTGCETPEFRRKTPPPTPPIFISSHGGMKTPFDDKISEAARELSGEEKPYLQQLYKIEGVDLAEEEPEQWPKENPYRGWADLHAALVDLGRATAAATNAFTIFVGSLGEYAKREAERVEKEGRPKRNDAVDVVQYYHNSRPWSYYVARMLYPNKRVLHLAEHAKKERVRKKNLNRINEWYARGRH